MALLSTMSKCVVTAYDKATAEERKQQVSRFLRLRCRIVFCDDCEGYHVLYHDEYALMDERHKAILEKLAMGLRDTEIAKDLGITRKQVQHGIYRVSSRLNAMSRPNLIMIATALGIINPTAFIAEIKKENSGAASRR